MNSTDDDKVKLLAAALFDEVILPLAQKRNAQGEQSYFPLSADPTKSSYYVAPFARVMQPADFEFPGGGNAEGLIDALVQYWTVQGETELASMGPKLKEIAAALATHLDAGDGTVSSFCYTLF
jgi:hypothetical protein